MNGTISNVNESVGVKCVAHIKYCPWAKHGEIIKVRCPYTGVWVMKESEWVTL